MPLNARSTAFFPDPEPRFSMSIPFLASDTRKTPILLPLFSRLQLTPRGLERHDISSSRATKRNDESSSRVQPAPTKIGSSRRTLLNSESFYLFEPGSLTHLADHGERKHSESSTDLDSDDVHDQLYADHDEDSDQGRPISPPRGAEVQEISARSGYRHDSEQPSALSDAPAPTGTLYSPFYAHPRKKRIRLEGEFKWYRSEGNKPIDCPPARDEIDLKNPFQEADVVVHEALESNVVQVWCWTNGSWLAIEPGYKRQIYGKTYVFDFAKNGYRPSWISPLTVTRRNLAY